jgi:hypothetical protein
MSSNKKAKSEDIEKLRMILDNPLSPNNKDIVGKENDHLESLRLRLTTNSSDSNTKPPKHSEYQRNPDLLKPQVTVHEEQQENKVFSQPKPAIPQTQKEKIYVRPKTDEQNQAQQPGSDDIEEAFDSEEIIEIEKVSPASSQFLEVKEKIDHNTTNQQKEFPSFSDKTSIADKDESYDEQNLPKWQSVDEDHEIRKDDSYDEKTDDNKSIQDFIQVKCAEKKQQSYSEKETIPEWKMVNDKVADEKSDDELKKQKDEKIIQETKQEKEEIVEWQPIEEENHDEQAQHMPTEKITKNEVEEIDQQKNIDTSTENISDNNDQLQNKEDFTDEQLINETSDKKEDQPVETKASTDPAEQKKGDEQSELQKIKESKIEKNELVEEWESIDEDVNDESKNIYQDTQQNKQPLQSDEELPKPIDNEKHANTSDKTEEIFLNDFVTEKPKQDLDDKNLTEPLKDPSTQKKKQLKEKEKLKQDKKIKKQIEKEKKRKQKLFLKQKRTQKNVGDSQKDIPNIKSVDDSTKNYDATQIDSSEQKKDKKTFTKVDDSDGVDKKFEVFKETDKAKKDTELQQPDNDTNTSSSSDIFANDDLSEWESYAIDETEENKPIAPAYNYGEFLLYKKEVKTAMGKTKTVHFFSKNVPDVGKPVELPEGYEVKVNKKTGLPYLKKI